MTNPKKAFFFATIDQKTVTESIHLNAQQTQQDIESLPEGSVRDALANLSTTKSNGAFFAYSQNGRTEAVNALKQTLQTLNTMDEKIDNLDAHLFVRAPEEKGQDAAKRFNAMAKEWDQGNRPSLPAVAKAWMQKMEIDPQSPGGMLLTLAAARAEMVAGQPTFGVEPANDEPAYHSRIHTLHVFQTTCYLLQAHQEQAQKTNKDPLLAETFSKEELTFAMIAAIIHDIDHPGRGNKHPQTNEDRPFFNEDASVDTIRPLIWAISEDPQSAATLFQNLQEAIRYTDPGQPHADLHKLATSLRQAETPARNNFGQNYDPKFVAITSILVDADILFSSGMGEDGLNRNSARLTTEAQKAGLAMDFTTAASSKFFFDHIVGPEYISAPARHVFNETYQNLRQAINTQLEQSPPAPK